MTGTVDDRSLAERIAAQVVDLPPDERGPAIATALADIGEIDLEVLQSWEGQARPSQRIDMDNHAQLEAVVGGRGSGKTRTGAEAVCDRIEAGKLVHGAFVSRTPGDVRRTMIEGPSSGFLACAKRRGIEAKHFPSKTEVRIEGGGTIGTYSAYKPDALRGPEHDTVWADEFASWPNLVDEQGGTAFSNLLLGLRLGSDPLGVFTTTPRAVPQMRTVMNDQTGVWNVRQMATGLNVAHLAPGFVATLIRMYGGTRLFDQEIGGMYIEDAEGALWTTASLEASRIVPGDHGVWLDGMSETDALRARVDLVERLVGALPWRYVAVDPSFAEDGGGDECGIVVGGIGVDRRLYVLGDYSGHLSPEAYGERVAWAWRTVGASAAIVEGNMAQSAVARTLRIADPAMPVEFVHARSGKRARAEPVAVLWAEDPGDGDPTRVGNASMVGSFPGLESECTGWNAQSTKSPNRIDALTWLGWQAFEHLFEGAAEWSGSEMSWRIPTGV